MTIPEDLEKVDWSTVKLDELLIKPSDTFKLKSKDIEKEIFMNYDLLMDMQEFATKDTARWELGMMEKATQIEVLKRLMRIKDEEKGTLSLMPDFDKFVEGLDVQDVMELFVWLQDHVSDFFTTRLFNLERRKSRPQVAKQRAVMTHLSQNYSRLMQNEDNKKPKSQNP